MDKDFDLLMSKKLMEKKLELEILTLFRFLITVE